MRLAVNLTAQTLSLAREAERLGFAEVFVPEGIRGDAITVLAALAVRTERIGLASGVCQIPARPPTSMALAAAALDRLSDGRFRLGLGISNAQVTEAWFGQPFGAPLTRMREYVEIVAMALRRRPIVYHGAHHRLPLDGRDGEALTVPGRPVRDPMPLVLAALGSQSLRLCGETADGWLGTFCSPGTAATSIGLLTAARVRAGADLAGFDAIVSVPLNPVAEVAQAARPLTPYVARFVGMGPAEENSYIRLLRKEGYPDEAAAIHRLVQAGDQSAAAAAVPVPFVDGMALLGPVGRIADRMKDFAAAGVTTLAISPSGATPDDRMAALRAAVEAFDRAGVG